MKTLPWLGLGKFETQRQSQRDSLFPHTIIANSVCPAGILAAGLCASIIYAGSELLELQPWALALTLGLALAMVLVLASIWRQPRARVDLSFKVSYLFMWRIISR